MPKYEWGYHSSDENHVHISVRDSDAPYTWEAYREGKVKDIFDVALYGNCEGTDEEKGWSTESLEAVKVMVELANRWLAVFGIIERLKADLAYHQDEAQRITHDVLDIDTAIEEYTITDDTEESYHAGRVEALANAIDLLLGNEVALYSESEES